MKQCQECQHSNALHEPECSQCGYPFPAIETQPIQICAECQHENFEAEEACQNCGNPFLPTPPNPQVSSQITSFATGNVEKTPSNVQPTPLLKSTILVGVTVIAFIGVIIGMKMQQPIPKSSGSTTTPPMPSTSQAALVPVATKLKITSVQASSEMYDPQYGSFPAKNLIDNDAKTCWQEFVDGDGNGQWIQLNLDKPQTVSGVVIVNGFAQTAHPQWDNVYEGNPRVQAATLTFSNGSSQNISLIDSPDKQSVSFSPVKTAWVKLTINSIYPGSKWHDTSLSEIEVYGAGALPELKEPTPYVVNAHPLQDSQNHTTTALTPTESTDDNCKGWGFYAEDRFGRPITGLIASTVPSKEDCENFRAQMEAGAGKITRECVCTQP